MSDTCVPSDEGGDVIEKWTGWHETVFQVLCAFGECVGCVYICVCWRCSCVGCMHVCLACVEMCVGVCAFMLDMYMSVLGVRWIYASIYVLGECECEYLCVCIGDVCESF